MKVAMDVSPLCYPRSGVGTYVANLLAALQRRGDVEVIPLAHRRRAHANDPRSHAPARRRWNRTVWLQFGLPRELARLSPDVVHFTNHVCSLAARQPAVLTIHDASLFVHPEFHGRARLLSMRPLIRPSARHARAVITVSEASRSEIVDRLGLPPQKVYAIPLAPGAEFLSLARNDSLEAVRRRWKLPERFVLFVGTIEPRKNLARLLEAWGRLCREGNPGADALVLTGQPGWRDRGIYETIRRLGLQPPRLRLLGHVSNADLVALYNLATCLAFPSLYEGFGLPVVEAMACGCPVLTSDDGALVEASGDAAVHVDARSVDDIATGLRRLLHDVALRETLKARGLARAGELSWDRTAQRTVEVYRAAVSKSTKAT
jgi:glycosyltransferase involved in cell wall biosynthesis